MSVPSWCPNLGEACGYPDCVYDDPECAEAESLEPTEADGPEEPQEPAPSPRDGEPMLPLTADDIEWAWRG